MIETIPIWVEILFIIVFLITLLFFYLSNGQPVKLLVLICAWALVQSGLALSGFYLHHLHSLDSFWYCYQRFCLWGMYFFHRI